MAHLREKRVNFVTTENKNENIKERQNNLEKKEKKQWKNENV